MPKFFVFLAASFLVGSIAHAQVSLDAATALFSQVSGEDIEVAQTPEFPDAFQNVSIRLNSNSIDLNRYRISWAVDGRAIQSGTGERDITIQTKNYGQVTTIVITIELSSQTIQKTIVLQPEDLTLLYEAVDAYVPPFYPGKKLPAIEGIIRVVAIPNFVDGKSRNLTPEGAVYAWKRNYEPLPTAGGYGKSSLLVKHNRIRTKEAISVTASSLDGSRSASRTIDLAFFDPEIVFGVENPITGFIRTISAGRYVATGGETILRAEPYFFSSTTNSFNRINFDWRVNNTPVPITDQSKKNEILVKTPAAGGIAVFRLGVENSAYPLQSGNGSLEISFRKP